MLVAIFTVRAGVARRLWRGPDVPHDFSGAWEHPYEGIPTPGPLDAHLVVRLRGVRDRPRRVLDSGRPNRLFVVSAQRSDPEAAALRHRGFGARALRPGRKQGLPSDCVAVCVDGRGSRQFCRNPTPTGRWPSCPFRRTPEVPGSTVSPLLVSDQVLLTRERPVGIEPSGALLARTPTHVGVGRRRRGVDRHRGSALLSSGRSSRSRPRPHRVEPRANRKRGSASHATGASLLPADRLRHAAWIRRDLALTPLAAADTDRSVALRRHRAQVQLQHTFYTPGVAHLWDYAAFFVYMTHFFVSFVVAAWLWRFAYLRFRRFAVLFVS